MMAAPQVSMSSGGSARTQITGSRVRAISTSAVTPPPASRQRACASRASLEAWEAGARGRHSASVRGSRQWLLCNSASPLLRVTWQWPGMASMLIPVPSRSKSWKLWAPTSSAPVMHLNAASMSVCCKAFLTTSGQVTPICPPAPRRLLMPMAMPASFMPIMPTQPVRLKAMKAGPSAGRPSISTT